MISFSTYFIGLILVIFIVSLVSNIKGIIKTKKRIKEDWGKEVDIKYTDEDFECISEYFDNIKNYRKESFFVDDITWNDLSMNDVFKKISTVETTVGEQYLYSMLREIIHDDEILHNRNKLIEYFQSHSEERQKVQYILSKLGKADRLKISDHFLNNQDNIHGINWYRFLGLVPFLSILVMFFNLSLGINFLILSIVLNIVVYFYAKKQMLFKLDSFQYITSIVKCAHLIHKNNLPILSFYNENIKESLNKVGKIRNRLISLKSYGSDLDFFSEYINIAFLISISNYRTLSKLLVKNKEDFIKIFEFIGIIDSAISIASYRERLGSYVTPTLINQPLKQNLSIEIEDLNHPLIESSIPNSINLSDSILITGSNASGKSTFLKTLAINIIFSQTIYTSLAKNFKIPYMNILTSMALKDNLFNNESYYIAETKSLKRIINSINNDIPTICFVDEILRGTNTVERIAASSEVLKHLTLNNCICIAATHDVELTYILEKYFRNYYFREQIIDNQIIFDYKIHKGRSNTRNAIKLLGLLGYDETIVNNANNRALSFIEKGVWQE